MKKFNALKMGMPLIFAGILGFLLMTSGTTLEKNNSEAIQQMAAELAAVKAELARERVAKNEAELGVEPFLGEIILFSGSYAPREWAFCEGQQLNIYEHQSLYSILGTTYGGDGRTVFNLPNLKEAEQQLNQNRPHGVRYIIALQGVYPSRR